MLKIAAVYHHERLLTEVSADLRAELQALTGQAFRRINRFIELAIFGALHCGRSGGGVGADTALYLASEAPMLVDCVRALRGVVAEGRPPKPFEFMNISGNMAGFYIAQHLRMSGPQLATHRKGAALEAVCELLQLGSAHHRRALLGYVEEGVWPLNEQRVRLNLPADAPILECSHWFYVDADCVQPKALLRVAPRCARLDEAADVLRQLPAGWRVIAGHGCGDAELDRLVAAGIAASGLPAQRPYSTGETAGLIARFVERPDAPGLAHLSRGGDGGYYPVLVQAC
ncbi:hypothetical protein AAG565_11280 [Fontimonas sp. SYSU GA230001]|uniref:hypothetical protein n=1 Tax=Fontimonas sp. SYSU GA230001 TaxID=3142450 RepID=UPI0032B3CCCF